MTQKHSATRTVWILRWGSHLTMMKSSGNLTRPTESCYFKRTLGAMIRMATFNRIFKIYQYIIAPMWSLAWKITPTRQGSIHRTRWANFTSIITLRNSCALSRKTSLCMVIGTRSKLANSSSNLKSAEADLIAKLTNRSQNTYEESTCFSRLTKFASPQRAMVNPPSSEKAACFG